MDVLRLPVLGPLLRRPHGRRALQFAMFVLAAGVVVHGLLGPPIAPRNLATVLTSIHWRGLLIVSLVLAGNLFCTSCPMVLVRDAGRRLIAPRLSWPRSLRRKWLALGLLVAVLFFYELFDVWERPAATAWIVLIYFALALIVDLLFTGASFCKHVCPIGQFNFVASTISPLEVRIREEAACHTCRSHDCIRGRRTASDPVRVLRRGCELGLFLPAKVGNLDCTMCLDCVHACPHDNVALVTRAPGQELIEGRRRSGIGRLAERKDMAVLAIVFTFASLVNAFAMTSPAISVQRWLANALHVGSDAAGLALLFVIALVLAPAVLLMGASAVTVISTGTAGPTVWRAALPYAVALVPFGVGVWLAHYGFHLFTGVLTAVPVMQSAAIDVTGWAALGEPAWRWAGMPPGSVYPIQVGSVLLGACGSLGLVQAISLRDYPARPAAASLPWGVAVLVLTAAALWILAQPMEMRGLGMA